MREIVVVNMPATPLERPPLELAVLKGVLEHEEISNKTYDLSLELHKYCLKNKVKTDKLMMVCSGENTNVVDMARFSMFIKQWTYELVGMSESIGILISNKNAVIPGKMLAVEIKKQYNNHVYMFGEALVFDSDFARTLKFDGHIDEYFVGDTEEALVTLLRGKPVEHGFLHTEYATDDLPFANFDDLDLDSYWGQIEDGPMQLPLQTSKGCIRNCDFCIFPAQQSRYRFRTGANIAAEMIHLAERYGIRHFNLLDSIANGNMKAVREWTAKLAKYNEQNPGKRISWVSGGWICRPQSSLNTPEMFDVLALSGCESVTIGAESASNGVLAAMNKGTTAEALYYELEQMHRVGIKFVLTFVHGHWSETWDNFLETVDLFYKLGPYARAGTLGSVTTNTFTVKPHTPAYENREDNQIVDAGKNYWWTPLNPSLTMKERFYRTLLLRKLRDHLQLHETFHDAMHHDWVKVTEDFKTAKKFYKKVTKGIDPKPPQNAKYYYNHFENFLGMIRYRNMQATYSLQIDFETSQFDHQTFKIIISTGEEEYTIDPRMQSGIRLEEIIETLPKTKLRISFTGKGKHGTVINADGDIEEDTYVQFKTFKINDIDLLKDPEFFYNKLNYYVNGAPCNVVPGFWEDDSCIELIFEDEFNYWYSTTSKANTQFKVLNLTEHTPVHRHKLDDKKLEREIIQHLNKMDY